MSRSHYLFADKSAVIIHTRMLGPGESDAVELYAPVKMQSTLSLFLFGSLSEVKRGVGREIIILVSRFICRTEGAEPSAIRRLFFPIPGKCRIGSEIRLNPPVVIFHKVPLCRSTAPNLFRFRLFRPKSSVVNQRHRLRPTPSCPRREGDETEKDLRSHRRG